MEETTITNLSTRFLLPLITHYGIDYRHIKENGILLNVFLNTIPQEDKDVIVFQLRKTAKQEQMFQLFSMIFFDDPITIDIADNKKIAIIPIREDFRRDYNLFTLGRYSSFSDGFKQKIMDYWRLNKDSLVHSVLYKTPLIERYWENQMGKSFVKRVKEKGLDYWSKPYGEREYFNTNPSVFSHNCL